jgi:hypothetical protein
MISCFLNMHQAALTMGTETQTYCFQQFHVDVARNATDDFNPFHDPHRWHHISENPYGGPIVLGFQLAALADSLIEMQRQSEGGGSDREARYSNYEFRFAGALRPGEPFTAHARPSARTTAGVPRALTRVLLRKQTGEPILLAGRTDSSQPVHRDVWQNCRPQPIGKTKDRSYLPDGRFFLKRKYLSTSNGKNFLLGSLIDQFRYFDELSERVRFPPMYTASLISCALLERARAEAYDFEGEPQVYVAQRIAVDCEIQQALRSNDRIDLLVDAPTSGAEGKGLSQARVDQQVRHCLGVVAKRGLLFCAQVQTASLSSILSR